MSSIMTKEDEGATIMSERWRTAIAVGLTVAFASLASSAVTMMLLSRKNRI